MRLRCRENIEPEYLSYVLSTSVSRPQIEANARTAVGNYAIGNEDVFNIELPLPSVPVQLNLISKINKVKMEISKLRAEAKKILKSAEVTMEQLILGLKSVKDI
jgi:restriction endonuclease S subunit